MECKSNNWFLYGMQQLLKWDIAKVYHATENDI